MQTAAKPPLNITLPSDTEIRMTREFNAPPRLVFEAWTTPAHVRRWFVGCYDLEMTVCDIDLRVGGRFRYVVRSTNGEEHGFNGEYREVAPPGRLRHSHVYEPFPASVAEITVTFEDIGGRTRMTEHTVHPDRHSRDAHLRSGMEEGATSAMNAMDDVLADMQR